MAAESVEALGRQRRRAVRRGELIEDLAGQERQILRAIPPRGHAQGEAGEPETEVLAEGARARHRLEVTVGGGQHPHVDQPALRRQHRDAVHQRHRDLGSPVAVEVPHQETCVALAAAAPRIPLPHEHVDLHVEGLDAPTARGGHRQRAARQHAVDQPEDRDVVPDLQWPELVAALAGACDETPGGDGHQIRSAVEVSEHRIDRRPSSVSIEI